MARHGGPDQQGRRKGCVAESDSDCCNAALARIACFQKGKCHNRATFRLLIVGRDGNAPAARKRRDDQESEQMTLRLQTVPAGAGRIYAPRYQQPLRQTADAEAQHRGFARITFSYVLMALMGIVTLPFWGKIACAAFLMTYVLRIALRCITIRPTNVFG